MGYMYGNASGCGDVEQNDSQTWKPSSRLRFNPSEVSTWYHKLQLDKPVDEPSTLALQLGESWLSIFLHTQEHSLNYTF